MKGGPRLVINANIDVIYKQNLGRPDGNIAREHGEFVWTLGAFDNLIFVFESQVCSLRGLVNPLLRNFFHFFIKPWWGGRDIEREGPDH